MGQFKGKKGTRGRPAKDKKNKKNGIKTILDANAIITSSTLTEAYLKRHPRSSPESARKNASRMVTPEVENLVENLLKSAKHIEITKDTIVKLVMVVIEGKLSGQEKTADYLNALKLLKELVPEFKDRYEVDDISNKDDDALKNEFLDLVRKAQKDA